MRSPAGPLLFALIMGRATMSAATAWNSDASAAEVVEYGGLITDMHRQLIDTQVEYFSELENAIADNAMIVVASSFEWTNEIIIGNGMTVDISKADGTDPVFDGQGQRFWNVQSGGTLTVSGLTFENGYDDSGYGGAAYITGIASFVNCAFNNNDAQYEAGCCGAGYGGVAYITGNASFTNCTFNNNKAKGGSLQSGNGGVAYITGVASFANCVFNNNNEAYFGGVAYVTGTASFVNCVFNNNILLLWGTRGLGSAVHVGTSYPAPWWDYGRCEFQEPVHSGEVTFVACEFYESYSGKEANASTEGPNPTHRTRLLRTSQGKARQCSNAASLTPLAAMTGVLFPKMMAVRCATTISPDRTCTRVPRPTTMGVRTIQIHLGLL